ncbi:protein nip100 [Anaeramoeba flamelloides]|uniref:Protein nip100 n=1 Tax=Anaeramoeba flamelloides TaxID=1746091 RepID=A0AAV7YYE2_9EUKA|nr:protein nip100 [Anaeramoeba flamelloides]
MSQKSKFKIGDRVKVQGNVGFIKYIGKTKLSEKAEMYGIEFEKPVGENDGSIDSTRYFEGKRKSCVFVKRKKVKLLVNLDTPISDLSGSESFEIISSNISLTQESTDTSNENGNESTPDESEEETISKESEKEKNKVDEDEDENEYKDQEEEMKFLKQIEELWLDKDESVILEELEQANQEIDLLAIERSSSMNKIALFEKTIGAYSFIRIKENEEEEQQNQEIEKLEKEIETVLSFIHNKSQEEIENQKILSQIKVDIENLGNNELSEKVEQKKEQVIELTRKFDELKEKNQKTEEQTTSICTNIDSTRYSHQNEIDDYKKNIDSMDDEILKDEERKKKLWTRYNK